MVGRLLQEACAGSAECRGPAGRHASMALWSRVSVASVALGLAVLFARQPAAPVTAAEIEADGGRFVRTPDGRYLECPGGTRIILLRKTATLTNSTLSM